MIRQNLNDVELARQLIQQVLVMGVPLLNLSEKLITSLLACEIKKRGITLWTWTIDNLERMKKVGDSGVREIPLTNLKVVQLGNAIVCFLRMKN